MKLCPREPTEAMLRTQGRSRPDLARTDQSKRLAEQLNEEMKKIAREIWIEMWDAHQ